MEIDLRQISKFTLILILLTVPVPLLGQNNFVSPIQTKSYSIKLTPTFIDSVIFDSFLNDSTIFLQDTIFLFDNSFPPKLIFYADNSLEFEHSPTVNKVECFTPVKENGLPSLVKTECEILSVEKLVGKWNFIENKLTVHFENERQLIYYLETLNENFVLVKDK